MNKYLPCGLITLSILLVGSPAISTTYTFINYPGAEATYINDINDNGAIVGYYRTSGIWHGFLYQGDNFTTIDYPGSTDTRFFDINNNGYMVGEDGNHYNSILYTGTTFIDIGVPNKVYGINDANKMVGPTGGSDSFISTGYYDYTTFSFPGADRTWAMDINNVDQIVGSFWVEGWHGFLYDGTAYTIIDYPGAGSTEIRGISNNGLIIGDYFLDTFGNFLFDGSNYISIDIPLSRLYGINNSGQIVGETVVNGQAVGILVENVLQPIPLPSAFWFLGTGLFGIVGFRKKLSQSR